MTYDIDATLALVKSRLNRLDENLDPYLRARIGAAAEYLREKGINLTADEAHLNDLLLLVDTTVHQYRSVESDAAEPVWLRNRIFERWTGSDLTEEET